MSAIVHSTLPSPVELRLFRMINDETGTPCARCVAGPVLVRRGRNEIDADFWRAWHEQNKESRLAAHLVVVTEEEALDPLP